MCAKYLCLFMICTIGHIQLQAQEFSFIFPETYEWNTLEEGDTLAFQLKIGCKKATNTTTSLIPDTNTKYHYTLYGERGLGINFDSAGNFLWVPPYTLIDRVKEKNVFSIIFEATAGDKKLRKEIAFTILHKNRPPVVNELPVLYVKQGMRNNINLHQLQQVTDPDGDPIVFKPILTEMPEGATLSELGIFSWSPSRNQFNSLKQKPFTMRFIIQDQPEKMEAEGTLTIGATQVDLPPEIMMVPGDTLISVKEDEVINLNFYVSDPNGDDNIRNVAFVSNDLSVPKTALKRNTATQWEFIWTPGYEFVNEQGGSKLVELVFYVLDEANKRAEKALLIEIKDTENLKQKDQRLYGKYKLILISTMNLIDQLDDHQKELNKQLKKARKGKKGRSIVTASLGAVTGVSPVFVDDKQARSYVSGIGGTTVMTLGTLEATEVVGKSKNDLTQKLNLNIDLRNQMQAEGDQFARKYALKTHRRDKNFFVDLDKLKLQLNNKKLILLELDAGWKNNRKPTDANLRKTFPDFNHEGFEE